MPSFVSQALFFMFFLSGFCGLVYQIVWLRLAFASFGILTPVLSVVISTFMLGLGGGSLLAGWVCKNILPKTRLSPLVLYGLIELGIGVGAFIVPSVFRMGEGQLFSAGGLDSGMYLATSALWIAGSILPWCILMGATFPTAMAFVKEFPVRQESENSFSFLYLANVVGAMCGTSLTAMIFVELWGFKGTLMVAAALNALIAITSFIVVALAAKAPRASKETKASQPMRAESNAALTGETPGMALYVLFATGFCSMAMEVVWTRAFTPLLRTTIYAFAGLLCLYLMATWMGSYYYRAALRDGKKPWTINALMPWLAITALLPLTLNDPRLMWREAGFVFSIFPFCFLLGYLTPRLIDTYSSGKPYEAGVAYALNVVGCIVGPLLAGYVLLPMLGVKGALILLALPFAIHAAVLAVKVPNFASLHRKTLSALAIMLVVGIGWQRTWEDKQAGVAYEIHRDHTATVIANYDGVGKQLFVNGIGITILATITKVMAHLPMVFAPQPPKKSLVICFGMGTTFRSLASWGQDATAVELLPSVRDSFSFFFSDAPQILADPRHRIVIDDGRRFLSRTNEQFDVITLDPPPPVQAAGSSLLYSKEFYGVVRSRLTPAGILHQWVPGADRGTMEALSNSLHQSFPYVRVFNSMEGWGTHFLASKEPIPQLTPQQFVDRMPASAQADLVEWDRGTKTPLEYATVILAGESDIKHFLPKDPQWLLTDEFPRNEYLILRLGPEMIRNAINKL